MRRHRGRSETASGWSRTRSNDRHLPTSQPFCTSHWAMRGRPLKGPSAEKWGSSSFGGGMGVRPLAAQDPISPAALMRSRRVDDDVSGTISDGVSIVAAGLEHRLIGLMRLCELRHSFGDIFALRRDLGSLQAPRGRGGAAGKGCGGRGTNLGPTLRPRGSVVGPRAGDRGLRPPRELLAVTPLQLG
jgi:hypothetical protein